MAEPAHQDPKQRTFAKLVRNPETNFFDDNALAKLIFDATEAPAGMFRANGTPLSETQNNFHRGYANYDTQSWVSLMSEAYKGQDR